MNVVGHYFKFDDFAFEFFTNVLDDFLQAMFNVPDDDWTKVLRTPDNMIPT